VSVLCVIPVILLVPPPRVLIWEDGTLEILNVTRADEGRYTCFAENNQGKDNSTGSLTVTGQPSANQHAPAVQADSSRLKADNRMAFLY